MMLVRGEYLECDRPIIPRTLKLAHCTAQIHRPGAERKMQIGGPALVIVQVHVAEPGSVSCH